MAIKPIPYKLVCPKCGHNKMVNPKSDALSSKDLMDMSLICPKCNIQMDKKDLNLFDNIFSVLK